MLIPQENGMNAKTKRVPITVSREDYDKALTMAQREGTSFAGLIRRLLKKFLRSQAKTA